MRALISACARHPVMPNLLMAFVLLGGSFCFLSLRRELAPEMSLDVIEVQVPYPSASAVEVEEGVVKKIENALQGARGIEHVEAMAGEGLAVLTLTLVEGQDDAKKQRVLTDVRSRIEQIDTFPADAKRPQITEILATNPSFWIVLHGNVPERTLRELAYKMRRDLQTAGIRDVVLSGVRDYEISIEVSEKALQKWGLTLSQVADAVRRGSLNLPGGTIRTDTEDYKIEIRGRGYTGEAYRDLPVLTRPDGTIVRMEQVAKIRDAFEQDQSLGRFAGERALMMLISRTGDEDALELADKIAEYLGSYEATIRLNEKAKAAGVTIEQVSDAVQAVIGDGQVSEPEVDGALAASVRLYTGPPLAQLRIANGDTSQPARLGDVAEVAEGFARERALSHGVKIAIVADFTAMISERIDMLLTNGWQGLALVLLALWLFLNLRLAFWVALGIPVAFAVAGMGMVVGGVSLNMISMFGLILVLGIVVDDAIVIGENVHAHRKQGKSPMRAAIDATSEMAWPVISAVTTTVIAFLPLFFVSGVMGKFIAVLPLAVVATLIGSLIEGMLILPAHLGHGGHDGAEGERKTLARRVRTRIESSVEWFTERVYAPVYRRALPWRYAILAAAILCLCLAAGMIASGIVPYVMFPDADTLYLQAELAFDEGTSFNTTRQAIEHIERTAWRLNAEFGEFGQNGVLVTAVYAEAGQGAGKQHLGSVFLALVGPETRRMHSRKIVSAWRELVGPIANARRLTFEPIGGGEPPTKDVELFLSMDGLDDLRVASREIVTALSGFGGVYDARSDFEPGKRELLIGLTPAGKSVGLTLQDLAGQLRDGFYGSEAVKVQRGRDEVKVQVRYPKAERASLADLYRAKLRAPSGEAFEFQEVASVSQLRGVSEIRRRDNKRRVAITASVDKATTTPDDVVGELKTSVLPDVLQRFPDATANFEGSNAENAKSMQSMGIGFLFALLGIYMVLSLVFRSYLQPVLIMVTIPLGLIGAIVGHWVLGFPFTLLSVMGVVALAGVVVNDALVLIERINERQRNGAGVIDAVAQAGPARFRAIVLTSVTTVAGLLPLLAERSFQAQELQPMALSLASGLIFATLLTLFVVPSLYLILNDVRRVVFWLRTGPWPTPEQVEPACLERETQ